MCKNRKQIEVELMWHIEKVWQDKPYTAVHVMALYNGESYEAYGFSKVQYPDKWDAQYGMDLAAKKALAKITKRIAKESSIISAAIYKRRYSYDIAGTY